MGFTPSRRPAGLAQQPAAPIATDLDFVDEAVAGEQSICHFVGTTLSDRLVSAVQASAQSGDPQVVSLVRTGGRDADSEPTPERHILGPLAADIGPDQVLLPAAAIDSSTPSHGDGTPVSPGTDTFQPYANYIEIHVDVSTTPSRGPADPGRVTSYRHKPTAVNKFGLGPSHIGHRVPGADAATDRVPFPVFRAVGCVFAARSTAETLPRPLVDARQNDDIDLAGLSHLPIFESSIQRDRILEDIEHVSPSSPSAHGGRLWVHFVERTPLATGFDLDDLDRLLGRLRDATASPSALRRALGGSVIEGVFPLTP